ncbi:OmpA family protein [candidate division KSB3 bacterium]|uniref:OmpA family protein n=1 Tax=candidate division KSB3 bacterium TaxID=2044937 RepID=A0A9D5Q6Z3_9BACT|nr:OmpA family protein [candidate division KSB3 bacterium]MBD3325752.1 OmpA family protein [candidate division KSB3 bacterium]
MRGQMNRKHVLSMLGIVLLLGSAGGCTQTPDIVQRMLGRDVAAQREAIAEDWCPQIHAFTVSPQTVECGDPVTLELAATSPQTVDLSYTWEIAGQSFETGQRAIWKTPTCQTIDTPNQVYTVRGIVSDRECAVTRSANVKVLCNCAFDVMVHFAFAKANLDATAKVELDKIGELFQQSADHTILIEGHTDYVGSQQSNQRLGEKRAEQVKRYLVSTWHIAPERIITRSFGEDQPIAPNETSAGRAKNRRAEVFRVVLKTK